MTRIMATNDEIMYAVNGNSAVFPIHPGEILGEELTARGLSGREFAKKAGLQSTHLSAIIHGSRNITPAVADKLAFALEGISADFWLGLQKRYNTEKNRRTIATSRFVAGYNSFQSTQPAPMLGESEVEYGKRQEIRISIPSADFTLLKILATKMNWELLA